MPAGDIRQAVDAGRTHAIGPFPASDPAPPHQSLCCVLGFWLQRTCGRQRAVAPGDASLSRGGDRGGRGLADVGRLSSFLGGSPQPRSVAVAKRLQASDNIVRGEGKIGQFVPAASLPSSWMTWYTVYNVHIRPSRVVLRRRERRNPMDRYGVNGETVLVCSTDEGSQGSFR